MTDYETRFGGISRLYGTQQAEWIQQARICIVGIGGVGTWVAEALARTGVGHITLIDLDDICMTNTNRQIHAMAGTVGQAKVDVMAERIKAINPDCNVICIEDFITADNLIEMIGTKEHSKFDYVIDAIDSINAKTSLIAHCKRNKIGLLVTGGAGGQTDPSQIQFSDLAKTTHDPLLSKVRNLLRRDFNFSKNPKRKFGVDCVFSTEQLQYPQADGSVCQMKANAEGSMRLDCNMGFGAATMVTGTFGFFAASKAINKILQKKQRELET
ncbi:tRNA cyclic N6-threonylcarbamoyladenosine(37) synthase TcdA [Psychrosphaera sp. F3M07]|uniref:tRNA cyclic N6-threonylcarbamoyladenosine(37) synthase TcdA n=1 Tax=Psychrosphaera sp. F3M07 TaxID=2841560 RepID=UPI001C09B97C|nr:tRNA cyclic N6-threonylcarbamoyladenosine(37) synthase TcdA [Psychrosphaera sp. F3M07]MBU2916519.1 tRNA cyclic N6-threonylcarbamoyladenosine(37) synthase TcdA [Psychrosphaera sp. F3M07]